MLNFQKNVFLFEIIEELRSSLVTVTKKIRSLVEGCRFKHDSVLLPGILLYLSEVFKMGYNIFVGQGTEFIRPDIIESQSQPPFDSPFIMGQDPKSLKVWAFSRGKILENESHSLLVYVSLSPFLEYKHYPILHPSIQAKSVYFCLKLC